jgi:prevent-host-death family protein
MKTLHIGAFDAKTRLPELLKKVSRGQAYVITRRGKPLAELRPVKARRRAPHFGSLKGRIRISPDFDAPLGDFEGYTR